MLFHEDLHLPKGMDPNAHTLHVVDDLIQATFGDAEEFPQCLEERKVNLLLLLIKVILVKVGKASASLTLGIDPDILHLSAGVAGVSIVGHISLVPPSDRSKSISISQYCYDIISVFFGDADYRVGLDEV